MIPRYEIPSILKIWSDQNKFEHFLSIELFLLELLEEENIIPRGVTHKIKNKITINPERISELEEKTKHDVVAFCNSVTEQLPSTVGRYFHYGVTSSDIIDSTLTLQIRDSLDEVLNGMTELLETLLSIAERHRNKPTIGRSHGMHAEPMSFGQKFLGHYSEFYRRYQDLLAFYENDLTIQLSGSVGNYTVLTPKIEKRLADRLKVKVEPVSTQVIPRDRLAKLLSINALTASAIERLAVEIRHLHRTEVNEVCELFHKGQKGSSTMPHKKNPVSAENLTGIARVIKSHYNVALENNVLWHERDISHSSAERLVLPDNFGLLVYAIKRLSSTLKNLHYVEEEIAAKLQNKHGYLSSLYLHLIIQNSDESHSREKIYEIVQWASFESVTAKDFKDKLEEALAKEGINVTLPILTDETLNSIYLKHVDDVFNRVKSSYPLP